MRVLAAMTLLLAVSCTFDYEALRGTASQGDGGHDAGARDALDATTDVPVRIPGDAEDAAVDTAVDAEAEDGPGAVDASVAADIAPDGPEIVMADAAPDGEPSTGGVGGTGATDSGGAGGGASSDTSDASAGGSGGGGVVSSGGEGGTGGVTGLGGSTVASSPSSSGQGGTTGTGGSGGTTTSGASLLDGGLDAPTVDASLDGADGADADEGDSAEVPLVVDTLTANPAGTEFGSSLVQDQMKLDFYSINKSVTLVRIEQYLTPAVTGTPLHWVIYRSSVQTGLNSYVLLADVVSPSNDGSGGYQSSPALNIVLEAGAYYAIGAYWQAYPTTYWYHTSSYPVGFPIATSFGGVLSALASSTPGSATVSWTAPSNMYYPQRLSTR